MLLRLKMKAKTSYLSNGSKQGVTQKIPGLIKEKNQFFLNKLGKFCDTPYNTKNLDLIRKNKL